MWLVSERRKWGGVWLLLMGAHGGEEQVEWEQSGVKETFMEGVLEEARHKLSRKVR